LKANEWVRKTFSFSKLQTFTRCPRKAYYRFACGLKEPGAEFFVKGRAVHKGQEENNKELLTGKGLGIAGTLDVAVQTYDRELKQEDLRGNVDRFATEHRIQLEKGEEAGVNKGLKPVQGTIEGAFSISLEVAKTAKPEVQVDSRFIYQPSLVDEQEGTEEAQIDGFVDVVMQDEKTGKTRVRDYKTGGRAVTQAEADVNLQTALYMKGAGSDGADFVSFVSGGRQKPTTKVTGGVPATDRGWERVLSWVAETIQAFRGALKTGDFPKCAPQCSWCSRTACGFYERCYPEEKKGLEKVVQVVKVEPVGSLPTPSWRK